jgi:hypothetical protein
VVAEIRPRIVECYRGLVAKLEETLGSDLERSKAALQDVIGARVTLQPDKSGKYLIAEYGLEAGSLLAAGDAKNMVAGAGFEPATFGL